MLEYQNIEDYLSTKSILYRTSYDRKEVAVDCLFCEDEKKHLYISNTEGCFHCKKCDSKGSFSDLKKALNDNSNAKLISNNYTSPQVVRLSALDQTLPEKYHQQLPERIKKYLMKERGLTEETIKKFVLGWNGSRITIPVFDKEGRLLNIRLRKDPEDNSDTGKMLNTPGYGQARLFNVQILPKLNSYVVICEGEFDAMILCQNRIPAICGSAGASTFKENWPEELESIKTVYLCYDTDEEGQKGAEKAALLLEEKAKIITLPHPDGQKIDVTNYLVDQKHTAEDFKKLMQEAKATESEAREVEIITKSDSELIYPPLDFKNGIAYFSLPLYIKTNSGPKLANFLISSEKKTAIIEKREVKLGSKKIYLSFKPSSLSGQSRWPPEYLEGFLKGQVEAKPSEAFLEVKNVYQKLIDFRDPGDAEILTLWVIGSYLFPIFEAYPYIFLTGIKRSGKTKVELVTEKLAFNMVLSSNISPSALFRLVHTTKCSLGIDEGEKLVDKKANRDLRELLNAGYKRGTPAYRTEKTSDNQFLVQAFQVYSPKMIANISGLESVLEDRAITVTMLRTKDPTKGNLAVTERAENWGYIRHLLYSFTLTNFRQIEEIYFNDKEVQFLLNRENELWQPLLAVAKFLDPHLPGLFQRIKETAIKRSEEATVELEDFDSAVLMALEDLVGDEETKLTNKEIRLKAFEFLEEDQKEYLSSKVVGLALKRFGIKGKKVMGRYQYQIKPEVIKDLMARYQMIGA